MTSAPPVPSSRRKRSRDVVPETAVVRDAQDAEPDSIALFLALHSPQPKVVRTSSLLSVSSSSRPPPSNWSSLPSELLTSVCLFLSSWRDLLRLSRVHRCFDAVIRSEAAGNHCWQSVQAVKLRISSGVVSVNDRRIKLLPDTEETAEPLLSSLSSPSLSALEATPASALPSAVHRVMEALRRQQQQLSRSSPRPGRPSPSPSPRWRNTGDTARQVLGQQRPSDSPAPAQRIPSGTASALCFLRSLRFVPRLRYCGELSLAFAASLTWSRQLRCLTLDITDNPQQAMTSNVLNASLRSLPALRSLSLGRGLRFDISPETLCSLSLLELELDMQQLVSVLSALPGSALCQSLRSLRLDRFFLPSLDLLPSLLHWDACLPSGSPPPFTAWVSMAQFTQRPLTRLSSITSYQHPMYASLQAGPCPLWLQPLRCLTLQLDEFIQEDVTLQLLSRLSALEHLTQLTLAHRAVSRFMMDARANALPSPLLWLPGLARLDFLHLQCHRNMDNSWIAQLLGVKEDEDEHEEEKAGADPDALAADGARQSKERQSGDVGCVGRLRWLGLRLRRELVQESTLRRWRRERCLQLQHCAIRWMTAAPVTAAAEAWLFLPTEECRDACIDEELLCRQRLDIAWQRRMGLQQ